MRLRHRRAHATASTEGAVLLGDVVRIRVALLHVLLLMRAMMPHEPMLHQHLLEECQ